MSKQLFTMGTLLRYAQDSAVPVRLLVAGNWLDGVVMEADGAGVLLNDDESHQVLVRLETIAAVRFSQTALDAGRGAGEG